MRPSCSGEPGKCCPPGGVWTRGERPPVTLPPGHDLALLSAIIHQNSPEENKSLFRKIHDALVPGGRIVVRDYVMSPDRTEPPEGAMFAVNMLAGTRGGSTYTYEEIAAGLSEVGYQRIRLIRTQGMFSLVEGFRKG